MSIEEMESEMNEKRKETKKEATIIRIQKPVPKFKLEEIVEPKEKEPVEIGKPVMGHLCWLFRCPVARVCNCQ